MKRLAGLLIITLLTSAGCGVFETVNSLVEGDHYSVQEGRVVWISWSSMGGPPSRAERAVDANAETFNILDDARYGEDGEHVFCEGRILDAADASSFHVLPRVEGGERDYAVDATNVWTGCERVQDADAGTFQPLAGSYGKDAEHVFSWKYVIDGADAGTFVPLDQDPDYGRDRTGIWYASFLMPVTNPDRFRLIGGNYSTDGDAIYYAQYKVDGADVASFRVPKGMSYGRDNSGCWTGTMPKPCLSE
ncbi:DKNYY domain-containing protein [Henriciella litoralis]|uniref:DKNYY domain-containing protein n=1 Tax=Henriciella litoralis TaxID=568102 RepID=UPI000A0601A1|nr:DKNYY domain-containing protein [Henriciella litoralis]